MTNLTDCLKAYSFAGASAAVHRFPPLENWWRAKQGLTDANAVMLQWHARIRLSTSNWPTLPREEGVSKADMKTWRRDVIAVNHSDLQERTRTLPSNWQMAAAYRMGPMCMVGTVEPPIPSMPRTREAATSIISQIDFLRSTVDLDSGSSFGVIVKTGPGNNMITLGTVTDGASSFEALPTVYVRQATAADAEQLLHI